MEKKKVLIIDDDVDLARSFQVLLEGENYEVATANHAGDGMEKLSSNRPDVLLLDIMMASDLEGYGIAHKLKSNPEYRDMPIIVISGMMDNIGVNFITAIEDSDDLPNVRFLHKPVDSEVLINEVKDILG